MLIVIDAEYCKETVHTECFCAECRYAECFCAECRYAECHGTVIF